MYVTLLKPKYGSMKFAIEGWNNKHKTRCSHWDYAFVPLQVVGMFVVYKGWNITQRGLILTVQFKVKRKSMFRMLLGEQVVVWVFYIIGE